MKRGPDIDHIRRKVAKIMDIPRRSIYVPRAQEQFRSIAPELIIDLRAIYLA